MIWVRLLYYIPKDQPSEVSFNFSPATFERPVNETQLSLVVWAINIFNSPDYFPFNSNTLCLSVECWSLKMNSWLLFFFTRKHGFPFNLFGYFCIKFTMGGAYQSRKLLSSSLMASTDKHSILHQITQFNSTIGASILFYGIIICHGIISSLCIAQMFLRSLLILIYCTNTTLFEMPLFFVRKHFKETIKWIDV